MDRFKDFERDLPKVTHPNPNPNPNSNPDHDPDPDPGPNPGPHPGPHPHPELPQVKAAGFQGLCFDIEMTKGEMEVRARARVREVTLTLG